jgi:hypothetical protein
MDSTTSQLFEMEVAGSKAIFKITENKYSIPLNRLFSLAIRDNTKRKFLFVSKVLGKHIPTPPQTPLSCGMLMGLHFANELYGISPQKDVLNTITNLISQESNTLEKFSDIKNYKVSLPKKVIFIGFAETATALGHTVFSSFSNENYFIHTTREEIDSFTPLLAFDEEHSHAVLHKMFPKDKNIFYDNSSIVLVDDELTTGKSSLNLIESLQRIHPRESYTILTILDWRSKEDEALLGEYENKLNTKINVVSLVKGEFEFLYNETKIGDSFVNSQTNENKSTDIDFRTIYINDFKHVSNLSEGNSYITATGRFGISNSEMKANQQIIASVSSTLKNMRTSSRTLCLGTGEFMYIPMLISSGMGEGVLYHSTTRSPIHANNTYPEYAILNAYHFKDFYDNNTNFFLYNIPLDMYEEIFIFFEKDIEDSQFEKLDSILSMTTIKRINIVIFSSKQ